MGFCPIIKGECREDCEFDNSWFYVADTESCCGIVYALDSIGTLARAVSTSGASPTIRVDTNWEAEIE